MLSIIFGGGAVRCCVLRAKVYSVPPIYIKLLRTEVFFRAQVWWAKIWARRRVCWISGFHPEIICCFGLCCLVIFGRLTKARKRVSLGMPPFQKSAVFLNIVQRPFAPPPLLFEHLSYFAGGVFVCCMYVVCMYGCFCMLYVCCMLYKCRC